MKITFLQDDFPPRSFGGAGISVYELSLKLRKMGHEISIITTCRDKKEAGRYDKEGLVVFRIYSNYHPRWRAFVSLNNRKVIKEVEKILAVLRPDVIHANNVHEHLSYRSLKIAKKYAPLLVTFRDTMAFTYGKLESEKYLRTKNPHVSVFDNIRQAGKRWNPLRNSIIRRYLHCADCLVAISQSLKEALEQNGIKPIKVIYNGIDPEEWSSKEAAAVSFKNKHSLSDRKLIFFNGRLSAAKGAESVWKSFEIVRASVPKAALLVAGVGETKGRDGIIFTGWLSREEMKVAYAASDVVLMPSLYLDPFGRVNIEAMASKKAVIGTCYGGTPEIVQDGVTGYVVDPRHHERMAERIIDLLQNPGKANTFGEAGYERMATRFNLNQKAAEYEALYKEL